MRGSGVRGPATTCYLARHCDVANPGRVMYGHLPNFPLSARGRQQADALGHYLSHTRIRAIYTSPLQRAQETASLLASELSPPPPILVRPNLVEAEFGRYLQGTRQRDVVWRKPRWWLHMAWPGLVPGDESMSSMATRVGVAIQEGLRDHPGAAFLCVSHGDPIQAWWATTEGRWPWALHRLQCAKGGMLELRYQGDQLVSKTYLSPERVATSGPAQPSPAG
ncbi:MAG: histidine phosphatase family protein [Candidatus Dormibacteria bacterium]